MSVNGSHRSENGERSALDHLCSVADSKGLSLFSPEFAQALDAEDKLARYRKRFIYPKVKDLPFTDLSESLDPKSDAVYLCGQSLGLQPKRLASDMQRLLESWGRNGVYGHFHGDSPFAVLDEYAQRPVAELVGAMPHEVAIMNGLTVNLHLLLVSFYRPTADRFKILFEAKAFPSDHYVFESQARFHGYDPSEALITLSPRPGEHCLRTEDIIEVIRERGHEIQVICFPGVQYYTGQLFDIPTITLEGHKAGCYVGWDLAHAIGNVELHLHDWNVDFAVWCHYKYMCAGAGATAGAFLHQKHSKKDLPRLQGWWSHHMASRFEMDNTMDLASGIAGYRLSNPSAFATLPVKVGAELILEAGLDRLIRKSRLLTAYLEHLLLHEMKNKDGSPVMDVITPSNPEERGAQLSIKFRTAMNTVFEKLETSGVVCDRRLPEVMRIAPKPIYNSFMDVYRFVNYLKEINVEN